MEGEVVGEMADFVNETMKGLPSGDPFPLTQKIATNTIKQLRKRVTHMKFTQVATGAYHLNGNLNHSVYALGDDGNVYKFYINSGWVKMGKKIEGKAVSQPMGSRKQEEQF